MGRGGWQREGLPVRAQLELQARERLRDVRRVHGDGPREEDPEEEHGEQHVHPERDGPLLVLAEILLKVFKTPLTPCTKKCIQHT